MFNTKKIVKKLNKFLNIGTNVSCEKMKIENKESDDISVRFKRNEEGKNEAVILYCNDITYLGNYAKSVHERLGTFLENAGYEVKPEYIQLLLVLHQFGGVDFAKKVGDVDCQALHYLVSRHATNVLRNSLDEDDYDECLEEGIDIFTMLQPDEMYADAYAIKNFIPALNHLREKGLIE